MKKAHLEKGTGKLLGWYDDEFHGIKVPAEKDENKNIIKEAYVDLSAIPEGCIEVTDEIWSKALEISANAYIDGEFVVKDFRTAEEIIADELKIQIAQANNYLKETEWVETYRLRNDLGLELIPADSTKWAVIAKREEYISFLRTL